MNTNEIVVLFKFYIINLAQITYMICIIYYKTFLFIWEFHTHILYSLIVSLPPFNSCWVPFSAYLFQFYVFFFLFKTCWTQFNHCCLYCLGLQPSTGALANFVLVKSLSPHLLCYLSLTSLLHKPFRPFLSFISRMFYHLL